MGSRIEGYGAAAVLRRLARDWHDPDGMHTLWDVLEPGTEESWEVDPSRPGSVPDLLREIADEVEAHDYDPRGISAATPEQPDTWERLEEDARKEACEYFAHMPCGCETSEMLDETVEKCNAAKARDLVRRAKKLAERGA